MYKYTASKKIVKGLRLAKKKGYKSLFAYSMSFSFLKDYSSQNIFVKKYENVVFYSENKRQYIPVEGVLFPVEFFDCEEI